MECFGDDKFGQSSPPPGSYSKVSAGRDSTCAIRSDGVIACWGNSENGVVTAVPHLYGFNHVSVGGYHACALRNSKVLCWGADDHGQATPPEKEMEFLDIACGIELPFSHHTIH